MQEKILTISELTAAIKKQLETRFSAVSVQGEISNLKEQSSGHVYFTLKDQDSQISAVLFRGNARLLSRLPKSGDHVIVKGELTVYGPRGNYQIVVRELQYAGLGALLAKLHELKLQLEQRGWFDPKLKKKLPKIPRTIGVITSPTGSVIQDILRVLDKRFPGFHLILNPVKVQGEGAAEAIAAAIDQFNQHHLADVLIVGRGGGSLEDLWAFNEEKVAAAIFRSRIPVISAVGHETDTCIADYVADVRAPTPSAAAEMVIPEKEKEAQFLIRTREQLRQAVHLRIQTHRMQIKGFMMHPLFASTALLANYFQRCDSIEAELDAAAKSLIGNKKLILIALQKEAHALKPTTQIAAMRSEALNYKKILTFRMQEILAKKRQQLAQLTAHLQAIDPKNLLMKGFCILFSEKTDSVILSSHAVEDKQDVRILLHDGQIKATIREVTHDASP